MSAPQPVYHLALRDLLAAAGARFVTHTGWSVPGDYGDPAAEYAAIREGAAVVERSQRSRFMVTGTDAGVLLGRVFAGYVDELEEGRAMRSVALDEAGNIRDVVLIARTGGIAYLVCGEPGQREETLARLNAAKEDDFDVEVGDRTLTTCLIGITGPNAANTAREFLADAVPAHLRAMQCVASQFHGFRSLALRTSKTGEDGFELMLAPAVAQHAIETLRAAGVPLAGFAAQETGRVEACIPAFEPDLMTGLTPAEADIDALFELPSDGATAPRLLSALLIDGTGPVSAGTPLNVEDSQAGEVRSCVHSPSLNATIGLGIVDARYTSPGQRLELAGGAATVIAKPFLRRRTLS
jgi:aminomethyltransferase